MELHLRDKCFHSSNANQGIAWCDEGILIIDLNNEDMDLLVDNRKVYIGTAKATDDHRILFTCKQMEEE